MIPLGILCFFISSASCAWMVQSQEYGWATWNGFWALLVLVLVGRELDS